MNHSEPDPELESLLEYLKRSRGFDFTDYKRSGLMRRIRERVKIYATDVDEEALAKARSAAYSAREAQGVSADQLARYFEMSNGRYVFNKELRRSVIFGRHDLIQDAPISRIDLLICRNAL